MYHGKYEERDSAHVQWWLTAGGCGLVVTLAFVGLTMWLSMESPGRAELRGTDYRHILSTPPPSQEPRSTPRPSRGKVEKVHKDEEANKPTHVKLPIPHLPAEHHDNEEIRRYQGTLEHGGELMQDLGVKESNIKKKSEAVYPSGFDPELFSPQDAYDVMRREEFSNNFANRRRQDIPPFSFIGHHNEGVEERIDSPPSNSVYYPDTSEEGTGNGQTDDSLQGFLRARLQEVREWLAARSDQGEWAELVRAINESVAQRNLTALTSRLRAMYNNSDVADVPIASLLYPDVRNGSSLISFGLLAVDLFMLHNVQQIAWNEEARVGQQMLEDPEVVAMNALFLSPDRVRQLRRQGSRVLKDGEEDKGWLAEALEFVNSLLRAVLNLNKAFRSARPQARQAGPNTMDCIWTLYCRNLDKTAKLHGPYGFLAKMNSLGLRLLMGEFPAERAFSQLVSEATSGWRPIDCQRLFPRCGAEEAKDVVMNTVLGEAPAVQT